MIRNLETDAVLKQSLNEGKRKGLFEILLDSFKRVY
jgi:hypothetical protein